jgi:hypothetical protein
MDKIIRFKAHMIILNMNILKNVQYSLMSFIQNIFINYCVVLHSVQLLFSTKNTCPTSKLLFLNVMMFPIKLKPML